MRQGIRGIEHLADPAVGEVRIGCSESVAAGVLPPLIEHLHTRVRFQVALLNTLNPQLDFAELRDRKLDMVLARALDAFDPREVADRRLRAAGYECELGQQTLHRSGDRTSRASEMAKAAKPLRAWCISVIGAKSRYIGRIEAPDEETAIAKTAEEFRIDPTRRFRLVLTV